MRKKRPNLAAASAVHDGEHAHLGVGALRQPHALETRQLGDAGVQVGASSGRCERLIPAEGRQDARLNLRAVRHRQNLPLGGLNCLPNLGGKLQGTAARSAPAPGRGPAHLEVRAESALRNPCVGPRPAVGGPDAVQLLVAQNRFDEGLPLLPLRGHGLRPALELPGPGRRHRGTRRLQGVQKILR